MNPQKVMSFLADFCTEVRLDDPANYVELMMDDHKCIEYAGLEYYVPEHNSMFSDEDIRIQQYLFDHYLI